MEKHEDITDEDEKDEMKDEDGDDEYWNVDRINMLAAGEGVVCVTSL